MAFEQKTWVDVPDPTKIDEITIPEGQDSILALDAENLNRIEQGIADAHQLIDDKDKEAESLYLPFAGGTMTGDLILNEDPTKDKQSATKGYVDKNIKIYEFSGSVKNNIETTIGSLKNYDRSKQMVLYYCPEMLTQGATWVWSLSGLWIIINDTDGLKEIYHSDGSNSNASKSINITSSGEIVYKHYYQNNNVTDLDYSFKLIVIPCEIM